MKVTGPNGLVVDVPETIATGLVGDGNRGFAFVPEPKEKPEPEASARKAAPRKPRARKTTQD